MNRRDPEAASREAIAAFARLTIALLMGFLWFALIFLRLERIEQTCKPVPLPAAQPERLNTTTNMEVRCRAGDLGPCQPVAQPFSTYEFATPRGPSK